MYRQVGDVLVVDKNFPAIRRDQPHDHVERSGFARPVRPEQADHLAAAQRQRNIVDDRARTISFFQADGA